LLVGLNSVLDSKVVFGKKTFQVLVNVRRCLIGVEGCAVVRDGFEEEPADGEGDPGPDLPSVPVDVLGVEGDHHRLLPAVPLDFDLHGHAMPAP
jgi:hypothetical protein